MTVSKQTLLNTLRTFKNLQESNGGGAQAVLDTVPATVDGGFWYDSDANAIKLFHNDETFSVELTPAPDLVIGGCGFNFSGFADLAFHDGKIYAADDTSHTTELGTVTTTFDGETLKSCSISVTNSAAFATGATDFSIEQVAGQSVKIYLAIDIPADTGSDKQWGVDGDTLWYLSVKGGDTYIKTGEATYKRESVAIPQDEKQQFFTIYGLKNPADLVANETYDEECELYMGTSVKGVVATEIRDQNTHALTGVKFTISADALTDNPTAKTVIYAEYYGDINNKRTLTNPTISVEAGEGVTMSGTKPATWDALTSTFMDVEITAGYVEANGKLTYTTGQPADGFYLTGLISGLVMFQNGNDYDFYKSADVETVASGTTFDNNKTYYTKDATNNVYSVYTPTAETSTETLYTLKSGAKVLATNYTLSANFIVKDAAAIADFDASAATNSTQNVITVELTNKTITDGKNITYWLIFDSSTELANEHSSTPAHLVADTTDGTTYTYKPAVTGWKFKQNNTFTQYTFVPASTASVTPFTLKGLASGLGVLTIDGNNIYSGGSKDDSTGAITAGTTLIGTFSKNTNIVTLNADAIPDENDRKTGQTISLISDDSYTLKLASNIPTSKQDFSQSVEFGRADVVIYWSAGTNPYYSKNGNTYTYVAGVPYYQFLIGGLKVFSDISITDGIITAEGGITVGSASGSTFTPNANFLPDNPDASTEISINSTGTLALATDSATAAVSQTFDTDLWTSGATAGTHSYAFTSATTGFYLADEQHIRYNATDLTGKTFTLTGLRTDLGQLAFDEHGYIRATNGSTIGRMFGTTIQLYENAVHSLFAPSLTGEGFTLVLP